MAVKHYNYLENISMPKSSIESQKRLSQSNDEKSIEEIVFDIDSHEYNTCTFNISMPKSSTESQKRLAQ